jgi:hypothetical protein
MWSLKLFFYGLLALLSIGAVLKFCIVHAAADPVVVAPAVVFAPAVRGYTDQVVLKFMKPRAAAPRQPLS